MKRGLRIATLFLATIALVFIAGCNGETPEQPSGQAFIGGTEALVFEFQNGAPPDEVLDSDTESFDVEVRVANNGEADVLGSDAFLKIRGIDPTEFGKLDSELRGTWSGPLSGEFLDSSGLVQEGGEEFVTFSDFSFKESITGSLQQKTFRLDACYLYKTQAITELCVLSNPTNPPDDAICEISGDKRVQNSAGPVQIASVRQSTSGANAVRLNFEVQHVDTSNNGKPFGTYNVDCEDDREGREITVRIDTGVNGLECTRGEWVNQGTVSEGKVYLDQGESRDFYCTQTLPQGQDFVKAVNVDLEYRYFETIEKSVNVIAAR
ncbi:hypothetical protein GF342_04120 [Candidatus Woesearchaeota archaeon]|nr:hypothetical protein [Candidatus Woesearchaeota archaeon]